MPDRFHWVLPGRLAGMSLTGRLISLDRDLRLIHEEGIRAIATLTEFPLDFKSVKAAGLIAEHFPIDDFGVPTVEQCDRFCRFVDACTARSEPVAVHCFAGLGRTGTLIACYLVRAEGLTATGVLEDIRRIEPGFVQTAQQEAFVAVWESELRRRKTAAS